jgi:hypothetical protein
MKVLWLTMTVAYLTLQTDLWNKETISKIMQGIAGVAVDSRTGFTELSLVGFGSRT